MLGRYRVDGDVLTLCLAPDGRDRPPGLAAPAGSKALLVTLKRAKPKE
jgi:hypothetical protein